jgi:hypothetical protein
MTYHDSTGVETVVFYLSHQERRFSNRPGVAKKMAKAVKWWLQFSLIKATEPQECVGGTCKIL